ncbi:MAG: DMT family transporter [Bacteroidota bacterium]
MTKTTRDYWHLHFIVLLWGFTAIFGVLISLPPVEMVFFRTLMAAGLLALLLIAMRKPFRIASRRDLIQALFIGFLIAVHWILFFLAARLSNVSVCLAGMATASLWTVFLEPFWTKERIKTLDILMGLLGFCGIILIFYGDFEYGLGLGVAVISAFLSGVFMVMNGSIAKRNDHFTITFWEMSAACLVILLFFPIYSRFVVGRPIDWLPQGLDWLYLFLIAGVCTVYAYSMSVELMRRMSAFVINLTVNLEPVYGMLLALLIFGADEAMSPRFYAGTLVIVLSVMIYPPINRIRNRRRIKPNIS